MFNSENVVELMEEESTPLRKRGRPKNAATAEFT